MQEIFKTDLIKYKSQKSIFFFLIFPLKGVLNLHNVCNTVNGAISEEIFRSDHYSINVVAI